MHEGEIKHNTFNRVRNSRPVFGHLTAEDINKSPYDVRMMDPNLDWRGDEGGEQTIDDNEFRGTITFSVNPLLLSPDIELDDEKASRHAEVIKKADLAAAEKSKFVGNRDQAFSSPSPRSSWTVHFTSGS